MPEYYMPTSANIPKEWIKERGEGYIIIAFPGWSVQEGGKDTYYIRMDAFTRKLDCDEDCLGYRYQHKCHHLSGLIWCCYRPSKRKGVQANSLAAFLNIRDEDLADMHRTVYSAIRNNGVVSDKDIVRITGMTINRVTPRRGELRDMGLIFKDGNRIENGRTVSVWSASLMN